MTITIGAPKHCENNCEVLSMRHFDIRYYRTCEINYCFRNFCVTFTDFESFSDFINIKLNTQEVTAGQSLFFSKYSSFPPLLLGRVSKTVKRCTKIDKAHSVVVDSTNLSVLNSPVLITGCVPDSEDFLYVYNASISDSSTIEKCFQAFKEQGLETCIYIALPESWPQERFLIENCDKTFTLTSNLQNFLDGFLPKLQEEELEQLTAMIKSVDPASCKTGLEMLPYFNYSDPNTEYQLASAIIQGCLLEYDASSNRFKGATISYILRNIFQGMSHHFNTCHRIMKHTYRWTDNKIASFAEHSLSTLDAMFPGVHIDVKRKCWKTPVIESLKLSASSSMNSNIQFAIRKNHPTAAYSYGSHNYFNYVDFQQVSLTPAHCLDYLCSLQKIINFRYLHELVRLQLLPELI